VPEEVHKILKERDSHYIILEDSICLAPSKNNCRTGDLIDMDNGIVSCSSSFFIKSFTAGHLHRLKKKITAQKQNMIDSYKPFSEQEDLIVLFIYTN
jgi:hypothetical protein